MNYIFPHQENIHSLFKFSSFSEEKFNHYESLFIDKKLYHATPSELNDPFESRPRYKRAETREEIQGLRSRLIKLARGEGLTKKEAAQAVTKKMAIPEELHKNLNSIILKNYQELRICSFTKNLDNLLLWAHYADSHKGFCIEFECVNSELSLANKVAYRSTYPTFTFPLSKENVILPVLIKSKDWAYEQEFRSAIRPQSTTKNISADKTSLLLKSSDIKAVYFGSGMKEKERIKLIEIINKGPFSPKLYQM